MLDIILLLRPCAKILLEKIYYVERIFSLQLVMRLKLLKLNSFIFYLINFEKQCDMPVC